MIITIASGKGGTGKTTFAVNLAFALAARQKRVSLFDCDVEEPNAHLFLHPDLKYSEEVVVERPVWDKTKCIRCGKCSANCRFNAITVTKGDVLIFQELCHSCGVCSVLCPTQAILERPMIIGKINHTDKEADIFFANGVLNIGEYSGVKLIHTLKKHINKNGINIIDAAPGTGCSVVAAMKDSDMVLLITEPTPFGLNDLKLAIRLTAKMGIPTGIVVNRSDGRDQIIEEYVKSVGLSIAGRIPFKREYAEAYSKGELLAKKYREFNKLILEVFDHLIAIVPDKKVVNANKTLSSSSVTKIANTSNYFGEIAIISGKGGTGKTTIAAAFAMMAKDKIIVDNDVDAPDLHILFEPVPYEEHAFYGNLKAEVDFKKCVGCGKCEKNCRFNAIRMDGPANDVIGATFKVDETFCEGCGLCEKICPVQAIYLKDHVAGNYFVSKVNETPMVHALLDIGEENSGRLVSCIRNKANELARELKISQVLTDGPPGIGCPVIASITGVDMVIVVTEPTISGIHDMERIFKLVNHLKITAGVIINKADLNEEQSLKIESIANHYGVELLGKIPFDYTVNLALMHRKTIFEYNKESTAANSLKAIWKKLQVVLQELSKGKTYKEAHYA